MDILNGTSQLVHAPFEAYAKQCGICESTYVNILHDRRTRSISENDLFIETILDNYYKKMEQTDKFIAIYKTI